MSKEEVRKIALDGVLLVKQLAEENSEINLQLEYSLESFTGTELDYALEVCEAVIKVWKPTGDRHIIINLPSTVEMSTPNIFADRIE